MNSTLILCLFIASICAFVLFVLSSIAAYYLFLVIILSSSDKSFIFAAPHNKEKNASEDSENRKKDCDRQESFHLSPPFSRSAMGNSWMFS